MMKALRPFIGLALPTMNLPLVALALQVFGSSVIAAYQSMNVVLQWMFWGIVADLFTGLLCSLFIAEVVFSPKIMARGVLVKGTCLAIVVFLSQQPGLQVEFQGIETSVGQLLGVYFLTGEWASALKNLDTLGAPFPKWASALLQQVHSSVDNIDIPGKITSVFKSTAVQKGPDTEIISKTETKVVTTVPTEKP